MPYIPEKQRETLDPHIKELSLRLVSDGQMNYVITKLLIGFYGDSYSEMNSALGVLDAVGKEYYRRVVAPYEDKKHGENGDVYL